MALIEPEKTASPAPVLYTAVGWVAGTYQPSDYNCQHGVLVTEDGQAISAEIFWRLRKQLRNKYPDYEAQPDFFSEPREWTVYPQTDPLRFRLVLRRSLQPPSSRSAESGAENKRQRELNLFRIVGEINACTQETVSITIRRNEQPRQGQENHPNFQPFTLTLCGSLPEEAVGQIWELRVRLEGQRLVVATGQPYELSAEDCSQLLNQRQQLTGKRATKQVSTVDNTPLQTSVISSSPATKKLPEPITSSDLATATQTTKGKMEVVVKLNQLPEDVKTVDKEWLEFVVYTGEALVTITVKPKVFAALEQAKLDYSDWVAAISGQMGEVTLTGFRLESPALKVFERKAKSPPEQTTLKNSQEPATELQPSSPGVTQSQQAATAQPLVENQKTPPAVTNSMQRPKEHLHQQRPTKVPLKQGQNQQRDNGQSVGQQPTTTTVSQNSHQSQPRFTVTVDGRVFSGFDSVTLNRRMVCIDGKFVGQAKMIVVLGEPLSIQADGEVRKGHKQAVLTSR